MDSYCTVVWKRDDWCVVVRSRDKGLEAEQIVGLVSRRTGVVGGTVHSSTWHLTF